MRRRPLSVVVGAVVVAVVAGLALVGCGGDGDDEVPAAAPGLFESQGVIDWDPVATRADLAARSDRVVIGTLTDVVEGYVFGRSLDDEFGTPVLELLLDVGDDDPFRLLWWYVPGHGIGDVRAAFPIGDRVGVYATRFVVTPADAGSFHHVGPDGHDHWQWTNPQGLLVEDAATGDVTTYDPSVEFDDAPPPGSPLDDWMYLPLPFEAADLAGLCEEAIYDFEEDAPSEFATPDDAAAGLVRDSSVLRGLDLADGVISLRGEPVGSYHVVPRPDDTHAVASAEWCYPD